MADSQPPKSQAALFQVYLRLRPPPTPAPNSSTQQQSPTPERFLSVEDAINDGALPTHITLNPPNDNRRRAVEKFAFTKVFEEDSSQLDLFRGTGVVELVEGVLGRSGGEGRDGLLATLGVTGSGKSHTILGSRTQRGLTQLALDVLFRSLSSSLLDPSTNTSLHATVAASDPSEAQVMSAQMFVDTMFADPATAASRASSRAPTPMVVRSTSSSSSITASSSFAHQEWIHPSSQGLYPSLLGLDTGSPKSIRVVCNHFPVQPRPPPENSILGSYLSLSSTVSKYSYDLPSYMQTTIAKAVKYIHTKSPLKGENNNYPPPTPRRNLLQRPSALPQLPDISDLTVHADQNAEYAILISMYEVYNDRIFDLLTPAIPGKSTKDFRRRPLLFKPTEQSPDRKVVAGLRKIICGTMKEALMVLEAGLHERRVAGTGSNSVSSRSHGFFCVEVKKRRRSRMPGGWGGSALTIVDLAGSERARDAKTQGATLMEAGKINESLMYLGQCLQMQSDLGSSTKPNLVPFRQCKLTELLFSNSFPSSSSSASSTPPTPSHHPHSNHHPTQPHRNPQKAIMIVTADPLGDFNATSQILRYSALAREITVPRIPSVSSTILAQSTASHYFSPRIGGRMSPSDTERETMEIAALEIARMSEEIDGLRAELLSEQQRRLECEAHLESFSERAAEIEAEVREECYLELENKLESEMRRWRMGWESERERGDVHLDRKLEIYTRSMDAAVEGEDKENAFSGPGVVEDLEMENERLRREVELLRREVQGRSPSKSPRMPLRESRTHRSISKGPSHGVGDSVGGVGRDGVTAVGRDLEEMHLGDGDGRLGVPGQGSPTKRVRKLTARKWDLMDEGELL